MTRKELLIIAIITFITLCAWVIFDILHTRSKTEIPVDLQKIIEPLNPNFDTNNL